MRLVSFTAGATASWGAIQSDGVIDLGARLAAQGLATLRAALATDALDRVRHIVEDADTADLHLSELRFEPVIPDPGQIICVGLNYTEHRLETKRESTGHPTIFARFAGSQVGHGEAIVRPFESEELDYEGELAIVIGRTTRRVSEEDALGAVAGYACYNDASIRDFQRHTTQFHPGKNFPATGAFGPWLLTADEVPDHTALTIATRLNGETVQSAGLDQLIFPIPALIAYCSIFTTLQPGDVIVTGTPGGVGSRRTPPLWMKPGDRVEVEISGGVGTLSNEIADG